MEFLYVAKRIDVQAIEISPRIPINYYQQFFLDLGFDLISIKENKIQPFREQDMYYTFQAKKNNRLINSRIENHNNIKLAPSENIILSTELVNIPPHANIDIMIGNKLDFILH